ncbi:hypothetical protein [Roseovarius aestuarii]|uniref:Uncharacterized protein n=1 Tax=Roseovarius aestuarii TaxID=475083 RepID=A0A1X7BWI3_9RHOB|nr:hypothetical protein [Roseovarius aestuarii]SMC13983.1 hypothetical protein ROA7745_03845 [Roseovarius aestuarii]
MSNSESLRIIVSKCEDMLVAQCLEYDICTQAPDMEKLQDRMNCLIDAELDGSQAIDPAPERFHNLWDQAIQQAGGVREYRLLKAA